MAMRSVPGAIATGFRLMMSDHGTRSLSLPVLTSWLGAAGVMGLDARLNLEQPDGHITVDEETRQAMVRVLRTRAPKVLFTSHWDDSHPDHAATARIVREAARLATIRRYDEQAGLA